MNLPRKRGAPRRKTHPIRPAWETAVPIPEPTPAERADPTYRAAVDDRMQQAKRRCERCWNVRSLDPHHVWPVSEGGPTIVPAAWLRILCRSCHGLIHSANGREEAERLGLIVPLDRANIG